MNRIEFFLVLIKIISCEPQTKSGGESFYELIPTRDDRADEDEKCACEI